MHEMGPIATVVFEQTVTSLRPVILDISIQMSSSETTFVLATLRLGHFCIGAVPEPSMQIPEVEGERSPCLASHLIGAEGVHLEAVQVSGLKSKT